MKKKSWKMPKWMEDYRGLIINTGGNTVEECVNDTSTLDTNAIMSLLSVSVSSQVTLLNRLHDLKKI